MGDFHQAMKSASLGRKLERGVQRERDLAQFRADLVEEQRRRAERERDDDMRWLVAAQPTRLRGTMSDDNNTYRRTAGGLLDLVSTAVKPTDKPSSTAMTKTADGKPTSSSHVAEWVQAHRSILIAAGVGVGVLGLLLLLRRR